MSYGAMHLIFQHIIRILGKDVHKNTHMARVFSAQTLYELGIPLSAISAAGDWSLNHLTKTYVQPSMSPSTLLAANGWNHLSGFDCFYSPRFDASVPDELISYLFPDVSRLEDQLKACYSRGLEMLVNLTKVGAVVLVQDAYEEALDFPANPVYNYLMQNPRFR